jgi:hypothetical protein
VGEKISQVKKMQPFKAGCPPMFYFLGLTKIPVKAKSRKDVGCDMFISFKDKHSDRL